MSVGDFMQGLDALLIMLIQRFPAQGNQAGFHAAPMNDDCRTRMVAQQSHFLVSRDEDSMQAEFPQHYKGQRKLPRAPRKRGCVGKTRGIGGDQIPVIVVREREGHTADFKLERLDAEHVRAALLPLIDKEAVLCSDGPRSMQALPALRMV